MYPCLHISHVGTEVLQTPRCTPPILIVKWGVERNIIACLNAWETDVQFCWVGAFCVASLLGRAVMQLFESLSVFMLGSGWFRRVEEGEILSSGQIFHSKTKHFVPLHHAWQEEGDYDQNVVKQRKKSKAFPSFCWNSVPCSNTAVVSHLISYLPMEPVCKPHKHKAAQIIYTCINMHSTGWCAAAEVEEQKPPLQGCTVMRDSLIVIYVALQSFPSHCRTKGTGHQIQVIRGFYVVNQFTDQNQLFHHGCLWPQSGQRRYTIAGFP